MVVIRKDDRIIIEPYLGRHSATVIFLHGLGDTAEGFVEIGESLQAKLPHVRFILLTADSIPITLYGGGRANAWFDVEGLNMESAEKVHGIERSVKRVEDLLDEENAKGLPYSRMALAGFSQGGALSLFCGLRLIKEKKLAGIVNLSGYLPGASTFRVTPGLESLHVLHCHGVEDPIVNYQWALRSKEVLVSKKNALTSYKFVAFEGLGHKITLSVLDVVLDFFRTELKHDNQYLLAKKAFRDMSVKELRYAIRDAGLTTQAKLFYEKKEFIELLESHALQ